MLSADSYRAPVLLFLKAKGSIKDHPGFVLYGNPPRWHKFDPGKHTDPGQTHYHAKKLLEVKAAQQIASEGSHGHDGASPEDHVAKMKSLAAEHQAKASASAAVTGWKKAMMAGKAPTKSQHDAMVALMATNREKAKKVASEVVAAIGAEKYQTLLDQAEGNAPKKPVESQSAAASKPKTEPESAEQTKSVSADQDQPTGESASKSPELQVLLAKPPKTNKMVKQVIDDLKAAVEKGDLAAFDARIAKAKKASASFSGVAAHETLIWAGKVREAAWPGAKRSAHLEAGQDGAAAPKSAPEATNPQTPEPPEISPKLEKDLVAWVADGKPTGDDELTDIHSKLTPAQQDYLAEKATEHPSLGGWKSALLAGKTPTPEQNAAKNEHLQKDHEAVLAASKDVIDTIGGEKYIELVAPHHPEIHKSQALGAIDWDGHLLPESNTNAKSHNAKVKKIQEAAYKGDVAALQAMKFGSNTYGKKQAKLAKQAIRALGGRVSAKAAPASAGAKAPTVDTRAPTLDGWKAALIAGKVPTIDQDNAAVTASESDFQWVKKEVVAAIGEAKFKELTSKVGRQEAAPQASSKDKSALGAPTFEGAKAALMAGKPPSPEQLDALGDASPQTLSSLISEVKKTHGPGKFGELMSLAHNLAEQNPKEGDVKTVNGHQYQLINGRWHRVDQDQGTAKQATDASAQASIPPGAPRIPDFGMPHFKDMAKEMLDVAVKDGPDGFEHLAIADMANNATKLMLPSGATFTLPNSETGKSSDAGLMLQFYQDVMDALDSGKLKAPGKPTAPALSQEELIDGWSKAIANGQAPTKEQADAVDALDDEEKMDLFMDAAGNLLAGNLDPDDDDALDTAHDEAAAKVHLLHMQGQSSQPSRATKPAVMFVSPASASAPTADAAVTIDDWTEQPGTQKGSNPGGLYTDKSGQQWYVKFPKSEDHVKNELLAAKLYQAAGVAAPELQVISKAGKIGIASKWQDGLSKAGSDIKHADGALEGFAVDAWLGNYDSVGTGYDNLLKDANGKAVRIDVGGSLIFRAQGAKKTDFGNKVKELQTMLDSTKNTYAAAVFGGITPEQIEAGVAKVAAISEAQIKQMVDQFGPGDDAAKAELTKKLIARRKDLLKQYPEAAKKAAKPTPKFDPSKLSAPPNFLSWGDTGKPGPSSVQAVNEANQNATQAIFAAAKTGDMEAVKAVKGDVVDKASGQKTGEANVLTHPSQHISSYAQQMLNEIDEQLNPPKPFEWTSDHPLAEIDSGAPIEKNVATTALKKIGKFVVLSQPGQVSGVKDLLDVEKITYKSGKLAESTYSPVMKTIYPKIPATQMQALKSYTGSGYHSINSSLWSGNPSGAAQSAQQAMHTHGHEIKVGTVLSRKFSLSGPDLQSFLASAGSVLQEPAMVSTSISPDVWGGSIHLKMHVGPGVKGMYVGYGSAPGGGAVSVNAGEKEMLLPPNTRLYVVSVKKAPSGGDEDGFGNGPKYIAECIILPTQE